MGQDVSSTIPAHLLIAAQHHGGLVLGAYDGRRMVGVLFGITALDNGRPYHYSHIAGVAISYQSKGVGSSSNWPSENTSSRLDRVLSSGPTIHSRLETPTSTSASWALSVTHTIETSMADWMIR